MVLLPNAFNYPIRVAERIGALDIMSRGRVEFGTGRSTWYEQAGLGLDPAQTHSMWEEALSIIPKMWATDTFSHEGEHFSIPQRNVLPMPIQKPHPPLWVAGTQPESFEIAGHHGIGILGLTIMVPVEETARRIALYKQAVANANPIGKFVNDRATAASHSSTAQRRRGRRSTMARHRRSPGTGAPSACSSRRPRKARSRHSSRASTSPGGRQRTDRGRAGG